jgi:hypothetical protein
MCLIMTYTIYFGMTFGQVITLKQLIVLVVNKVNSSFDYQH